MALQVNNQETNYTIPRNENAIAAIVGERRLFKNRIKEKYQGFQAPFSERQVLLVFGDALIVILAALGAFLIWYQTENSGLDVVGQIIGRWHWVIILLSGWWGLAWLNDLYDIPSSLDKISSAIRIALVGLINLFIYLTIFSLIPSELPRNFFLYFLIIVWLAITLWRYLYATLYCRLQHRVLIVGRGERGQSIARVLKQTPKLNYQVLGYVDDGQVTTQTADDGLPVWNHLADLPKLVQNLQVQEVVVAIEQDLRRSLFHWLVECQANGVRVSLMPILYQKLYRKIPIEHIDPSWALYAIQNRPVFSRLDLGLKRLMDLVLATVGLLVLAPILPLIALAVHFDSPGPIFYRQIRCGRAGKLFSIIKFRTMVSDAEKDGKPRWATKNDRRITRVGRFLRKTRLDELPQLINILRGEMSVIGPRPERPEFVEQLQQEVPFYRTRLMVKPGLTGWAQVNYNYGNNVEDALVKLQYDFYYLQSWSLWLDLYIIFQTIGVVLKFKGT